ncbi:MAG TPA: GEVED domain-containing protein, partial [Luteibaculaceae bacterium]|nr:GEVED domain-containing protein [Luteibaculaceae bacterium]
MKTIRWMSCFLLLCCAGVGQAQNYRSYVLDANIPYQWEEFNPLVPTEVLALAGEDEVYALNLPFPFRYFDSTYTTAFVGINGYISFGRNYNQSDFNREHLCNPVPQLYNPAGEQNSLNPDNFIAVFWDDLFLDGSCTPLDGGTPKLAYRVTGAAPNRVLVVVWDYFVMSGDLLPCATQTPEFAQQVNVQVKLFEGTNVIEVHLKNNQVSSQEATIAVENAAGNYAEYAHCSAANPPPAGPKAYRFTPSLDAPTGGPSSAYCTARGEDCIVIDTVTNSADTALRYISNVSISNLNNRSICSNQGYSDYTNLGPIRLDTGTTYLLTVNTRNFGNAGYVTRVWVDWNRDTLFSFEELTQLVGTSIGTATGEGVYLAQLTPPDGTPAGIYRMRIRYGFALNNIEACGPDDVGEVEDYHIAVNTPAGYCAAQGGTCPGPDLENPNFDHIINFQATTNGNDVSNLSNCNSGYGDFTADQNLWVNWDLEGNYTVVIKRLVPDYINAKAGLWIDWNQDSDFDDSGERFLGVANILDSTTTFPILVPQDAVLGNTRLRVRTTSSLTDDARPCGVQAFGEVEDYTVVIFDPSLMPPTCANIISPAADAQNLCQTVNLVWNAVDGADGYKLTLKETNPDVFLQNEFSTTDTTFTPAGRLTPGKTYAWIVVPFNQDGDAPSCDTVRFTIAPNGDPIANLLPNVDTAFVCANNTLQLDGNLSNGTAPFTHLWTGLNASLLSSTTIVNPVFTGASTGNFKYNYDVTDQNGCSSKDSIVISIIPEVIGGILNADDPKICVGESTLIRHRSYVGNVQIQDSIAGGAWADVDLLSPNADVYATGTLNQTRYYRAVVGSSTCGDTSNVIEVVVNAIPAAPLVQASGPTTFCNGD